MVTDETETATRLPVTPDGCPCPLGLPQWRAGVGSSRIWHSVGDVASTNLRGGSAAEGGSLHRAGVAALLAARGLLSSGVIEAGFSHIGPAVTRITLEAKSAVDDIVCELNDGSTWYIQAKRTCGKDQNLRDTIAQWVEQALGPADSVGLAVRSPRGIVKYLGSGLDKLRNGRDLSADEGEAVRQFMQLVIELGGSIELVEVARVLICQVEDDRDLGAVTASSLLSAAVVATGQGEAAFRALRSHFHALSASGGSSSPPQWVDVLREQHLDLIADSEGPIGQRIAALRNLDHQLRARYLLEKDRLELSLFADDLPPVSYPDLLDLYQVTDEADDDDRGQGVGLAPFARSVPKFVLEGLPGSGKSTALIQLAAAWADDPRCPTPVYVQLRYLANRITRSTDVTLRLLVETSLRDLDNVTPQLVDQKVMALLSSDHWVLILDGLDETSTKRGVITDGLLDIVKALPELSGLILATRHTAVGSVKKLKFPVLTLKTPNHLEDVLSSIIDHAAEQRGRDENWAKVNKSWLHEQLRTGHALWSIPLTATLMTLAQCQDFALPISNKGILLRQGIDNAVRRWELANKSTDDLSSTPLNADILLFSFATSSRVLIESPELGTNQLVQQVEAALYAQFGTSPLQSRAAAAAALQFWTERMGLFLTTGGGIAPRHRQIAEVGDAMWVETQTPDVQLQWLRVALTDDTNRDRVELATDLDPSLLIVLGNLASQVGFEYQIRALEWVLNFCLAAQHAPSGMEWQPLMLAAQKAALDEVPVQREEVTSIGDRLRQYVRSVGTTDRRWHWTYLLVSIPLPSAAVDAQRWQLIDGIDLGADEREQVSVLACLARGKDVLGAADQELIMRVLSRLASLAKSKPRTINKRKSRKAPLEIGSGRRLPLGASDIAKKLAPLIDLLPSGASELLFAIANSLSVHDYAHVSRILTRAGFSDPDPHKFSGLADFFAGLPTDGWYGWDQLLGPLANGPADRVLSAAEIWRSPDLRRLIHAADLDDMHLTDLKLAQHQNPDDLRAWYEAVATAYEIDLEGASAQATEVLGSTTEPQDRLESLFVKKALGKVEATVSALTGEHLSSLRKGIGSQLSVVRSVSTYLLCLTEDPATAQAMEEEIGALAPEGRRSGQVVICICSANPVQAAQRALEGGDLYRKLGVAWYAKVVNSNGGDADSQSVLATVATHPDMAIRDEAGRPQDELEAAEYWSCTQCERTNLIEHLDCQYCPKGARPGRHPG